jgi:hypothetical protein
VYSFDVGLWCLLAAEWQVTQWIKRKSAGEGASEGGSDALWGLRRLGRRGPWQAEIEKNGIGKKQPGESCRVSPQQFQQNVKPFGFVVMYTQSCQSSIALLGE